jgi:hypothetical protein
MEEENLICRRDEEDTVCWLEGSQIGRRRHTLRSVVALKSSSLVLFQMTYIASRVQDEEPS